ncbi:hypothetical protein M9H77_33874 [Catharanthus roseus]|uniref:Uncharacterized protein n=1 Tax=Catharanthus roseus TaxID=4058 RepID=A0ACB9ZJN4_CATRO|nr:hypothetical protein M9H77_33874 [Catharanthus roseus]
MVSESKKKRAHSKTSAPALASIYTGTSASSATTTTPLATLTQFPQLLYSSPMPISTPFSSSAGETSSRPASSSSAHPLVPPVQGFVDSRILILPTADRLGIFINLHKHVLTGKWGKEKRILSQEGLETKIGLMENLVGAPRICSLVWPMIWRLQLLWKSSARRCLAGIDYEMPELGFDDLVML